MDSKIDLKTILENHAAAARTLAGAMGCANSRIRPSLWLPPRWLLLPRPDLRKEAGPALPRLGVRGPGPWRKSRVLPVYQIGQPHPWH